MCSCAGVPVTCIICIAAWSLNTHQTWSQSAKPFLSFSSVANFDTLYVARATWLPKWMGVGSIQGRSDAATHQRRPFVNRTHGCRNISSSKASWDRVAHTQFCPLITKELRSVPRAPLVITHPIPLASYC